MRIRTAVLNQEHALAEQMAQRKAFNAGGVHDSDHMAMYPEDFKGSGGFAGPDTKKRRGVSSTPYFAYLVPVCFGSWHYFCRESQAFPLLYRPSFPDWAKIVTELTKHHYRKPPLLVVATAATGPKLQNGVVVLMALGHCAMPVAYTMPN